MAHRELIETGEKETPAAGLSVTPWWGEAEGPLCARCHPSHHDVEVFTSQRAERGLLGIQQGHHLYTLKSFGCCADFV